MTTSGPAGRSSEVLIIGAGQAGLAVASRLVARGVGVHLLEAADVVGASWRRRWDSLRLFTPAADNALPSAPFPGPESSHPGKEEVAAYLQDYARAQGFDIRLRTRIASLDREGDRFVAVDADNSQWSARRVVVATGAFGLPFRPAWAARLDSRIVQLHTDEYQGPEGVPPGYALVVGAGNSGVQVALELAQHGRRVDLAQGRSGRHIPQQLLGRDVFFWLRKTGLLSAPAHSVAGRLLRHSDPIIGISRDQLEAASVTLRPRATDGSHLGIELADGSMSAPGAVIWATGYRHDDRWIHIADALDEHGALPTHDGETPIAGLHTIGRSWQQDRGSALLGFVGRDADRLAARLSDSLRSSHV